MIPPTNPRLIFLPEGQVLAASGPCMAYRDRYWCVHPDTGAIIFYTFSSKRRGLLEASPQCNSSESGAERLRQQLYPWADLRFIPLVLQPRDFT